MIGSLSDTLTETCLRHRHDSIALPGTVCLSPLDVNTLQPITKVFFDKMRIEAPCYNTAAENNY